MMSASCFWLNISRCICICCRPLLGEAVARCRLRFCGGSRPRHADRPAAAAVGRSAARLEIGGRRQLQAVQIVFMLKKLIWILKSHKFKLMPYIHSSIHTLCINVTVPVIFLRNKTFLRSQVLNSIKMASNHQAWQELWIYEWAPCEWYGQTSWGSLHWCSSLHKDHILLIYYQWSILCDCLLAYFRTGESL